MYFSITLCWSAFLNETAIAYARATVLHNNLPASVGSTDRTGSGFTQFG